MFNPLFIVKKLFLLAATSGSCDTPEIPIPAVPSETAVVALDLGTLTLAEKVKHYQSLTKVVKDLVEGIGIGDTCVAHHVYMMGAQWGLTKLTPNSTCVRPNPS